MATSKSSKATTKKHSKMDPKLLAADEEQYVQTRFLNPSTNKHIAIAIVRATHKRVGRSRVKVYADLKQQGFTLLPYKRKKKSVK